MKLKLVVLALLPGITYLANAQDLLPIGVEPSANIEAVEALKGLPMEEILQKFELMEKELVNGTYQNQPNNVSADELDTRALNKILRSLTSADRPQLLEKLDNDAKSRIREIAEEARQFSLGKELESAEVLCSQWLASRAMDVGNSVRSELSLEAYRNSQARSLPTVNDRYQQSLTDIKNSLSSEESKYFFEVFDVIREGYLDAMIVNWDDFVRSSPNSTAMIEGRCAR